MKLNECMVRMDYIPQKVNYIEGIPAHLAGEWPGIKSSKWNGSIKVLDQVRLASFKNPNPALPAVGRKHFSPKYCKESGTFKNKRLIRHSPKEDKKTGVKQFENFKYLSPKEYNKVKISTPGKINHNFINNYNEGINSSNNNIENENNNYKESRFMPRKRIFDEKYNKITEEFYVNKKMGMKKKISNIEERRNGMPLIAPGDKIYKNPEFSEDYFKEGGLVVGSTNRMNYKKNQKKGCSNFYETLDLNIKTLDEKKLWKNKVIKEELDYQKDFVKNLNNWEEETFGKAAIKEENKTNLNTNNTNSKQVKESNNKTNKKK